MASGCNQCVRLLGVIASCGHWIGHLKVLSVHVFNIMINHTYNKLFNIMINHTYNKLIFFDIFLFLSFFVITYFGTVAIVTMINIVKTGSKIYINFVSPVILYFCYSTYS